MKNHNCDHHYRINGHCSVCGSVAGVTHAHWTTEPKDCRRMSESFGMPGPGGSLGTCALCGNVFLAEILFGKTVQSFTVDGCNQTLYGHKDCLTKYAGKKFDVLELPESSPLRQAYNKAVSEGMCGV